MSTHDWLDARVQRAAERLVRRPAHERAEANKYTRYTALKGRELASFEWGAQGVELHDFSAAMSAQPERMQSTLGALATGAWADASLANDYGLVVLHLSESGPALRLTLNGLGQGFSAPRLVMLTEPNVERIVEIELSDEHEDHHLNLVIEADLADSSQIDLTVLQDQRAPGLTTTTCAVRVGKSSEFNGVWLDCGSRVARHDVQVDLADSGAKTQIAGLMLPSAGQHQDHHVHVRHSASDTHSNQLFKGLVASKGRSVFTGCVEVCEGAKGCSAEQMSRGLLLGESAEFDARPQLLISYDAVEASHGSSCGAMDEDALFFMRSRGLSMLQARYLMAQAFAGEVHELIDGEDLIERSHQALEQLLEGLE